MKKLLFVFLLTTLATYPVFAQVLPRIDRYNLATEEGCAAADKIALKVADYLFHTPMIKDDENRMRAESFLNRWMEGTPTYNFVIDKDVLDNFEGDVYLENMFMAGLTRFTLQNPSVKNDDAISIGAMKQVLDYANNDDNKVLLTRRLEKLLAAEQKGDLEKKL